MSELLFCCKVLECCFFFTPSRELLFLSRSFDDSNPRSSSLRRRVLITRATPLVVLVAYKYSIQFISYVFEGLYNILQIRTIRVDQIIIFSVFVIFSKTNLICQDT